MGLQRTRLTLSMSMVLLVAADGLDQAADAEVAGVAQNAAGGADDQVDGGAAEGVVSEAGAVEFAMDEVAHVIRIEPFVMTE